MDRSMVKHVKEFSAKAKQVWAKEKPKLDNATGLRRICHIDPEVWHSLKLQRTREERLTRIRNQLCCASRKHAQENLQKRRRYLHKSNNAMNKGMKQFHATSKFIRRFMSTKSKLMHHKDAAPKKTVTGVMKTILLTEGMVL